MFATNSVNSVILYISDFNSYVTTVTVNNIQIEKQLNKMSEVELDLFINEVKLNEKIFSKNDYTDNFTDDIIKIPYSINKDDSIATIKINDKNSILDQNIEIMIIEYNFDDENYIFSSNKILETLNIKRTSSGYFNFKVNNFNDNRLIVLNDKNKIIVLYEVEKF